MPTASAASTPASASFTSRLGLAHPVVQGPFGGGLSTVALAAAVSNRGGLGSYGAHVASPDDITRIAAELRAATSAPFALNLWVSDHDAGGDHLAPDEFARVAALFAPYFAELGVPLPAAPPARYGQAFDEQIEALLAAAPPVFSFVFGVPSPKILEECRRRHIFTVGAATTLAEAQAIEAAGVDAVVATGLEAGGHRPSFLAAAEASLTGTLALTRVASAHLRIPVIAAGGIADQRGVHAALALGASAAQLGTAFLACEESGTSALHKRLLFSERARTTALTRGFTGRLARGMVNRLTRELAPKLAELPPYPVPNWFLSKLKAAAIAQENPELMSLWCGQAAPLLQHRSAAALFDSLVA